MNFQAYLNYFKEILDDPNPPDPYDNPEYIDYTKLNWSRMNRWLKKGEIDKELKIRIKAIDQPQTWLVITEPWCGDAAHIVPFFQIIADLNPMIQTVYELRDAPPYSIENYLTDGKSKSIPILAVKDEKGKEQFHWGPRPKEAQALYKSLLAKNADFEEMKISLQKWYNNDKGQMLQKELLKLFNW